LKDYCQQSADVEIEWFDSFKRLRDEDRIKIFDVSYDENMIKSMRSQVELAREYFARIMQDFVN
jgi:DNA-binding transcriptional regulator YiaG